MATTISSDMVTAVCMAFDIFSSQDISSSLVEQHNQNLSQAQKELLQQITFSGSSAHHQNGISERSIQKFLGWARTIVLHAAIHWHEMAGLLHYNTHYVSAILFHINEQSYHLCNWYPVFAFQTILAFNDYIFGDVLPLS